MLHFYHFIAKKIFLQFSKCSHPCLIFLNMSCSTVEIGQSNWMYVSWNSTQTFESNVFKIKFFVELGTVMLFIAFKVWITINDRVKWKLMWIWIFFGEKSKNWDKVIQSGTPGQHTKNQECSSKTKTVGMFVTHGYCRQEKNAGEKATNCCNRWVMTLGYGWHLPGGGELSYLYIYTYIHMFDLIGWLDNREVEPVEPVQMNICQSNTYGKGYQTFLSSSLEHYLRYDKIIWWWIYRDTEQPQEKRKESRLQHSWRKF